MKYCPETGVFTRLWKGEWRDVSKIDAYGYMSATIDGVGHKLHRLAFLYMDGYCLDFVDHISGIKSDNRWCNLRPATREQNMQNMKLRKDSKSGVKGVSWDSKRGVWCARIAYNKKTKHIGMFENLEDAVEAISYWRNKLHEEYARHK